MGSVDRGNNKVRDFQAMNKDFTVASVVKGGGRREVAGHAGADERRRAINDPVRNYQSDNKTGQLNTNGNGRQEFNTQGVTQPGMGAQAPAPTGVPKKPVKQAGNMSA